MQNADTHCFVLSVHAQASICIRSILNRLTKLDEALEHEY